MPRFVVGYSERSVWNQMGRSNPTLSYVDYESVLYRIIRMLTQSNVPRTAGACPEVLLGNPALSYINYVDVLYQVTTTSMHSCHD